MNNHFSLREGTSVNVLQRAKTAYGSSATPVRTDRGTEYALFSKITHRMRASALRGKEGFSELAEALHSNRQLWNTLAADVSDKANALPPDLRARIFFLAEFTTQHTHKVLNGKGSVAPLIEVNAAIMRGLGLEGRKT
jgi:flagellar protein FlaF